MGAAVATTNPRSGMLSMQGIVVPQASIDPKGFFQMTRRQRFQVRSNQTWLGHGARESIQIPAVGILSAIVVTVKGTATITTAAATTSYRWPYDLLKAVNFSANGQSSLISASGWKLKAREMMKDGVNDRGVTQTIAGTSRNQGTLSLAQESWGMTQGTSNATGTYNFEIDVEIPVAADPQYLIGAIFSQTSSTQLLLEIEWNTVANLVGTNPGNVAFSNVTYTVETEVFSLPSVNGVVVLPDLSSFHFFTQFAATNLSAGGDNEYKLVGVGLGKSLLRILFQVWNNGQNNQPLAMTTANFPSASWRYGGAEVPEKYLGGTLLARENERNYNSAIGAYQGFGCFDFAVANAFRDIVDEGSATELRFGFELATGTTVSNPVVEIVREEVMSAPTGL